VVRRFATFASRGVRGAWPETIIMPSNFKKLVRARMAKTGEGHQTAARHVRADATTSANPEAPSQTLPAGTQPMAATSQVTALVAMSNGVRIDPRVGMRPATVFASKPRSEPRREPVCAVTFVYGRPTAKSPFGRKAVNTMCGRYVSPEAVDDHSLTNVPGDVSCSGCKAVLDNGGFYPGPGSGMCLECDRYPVEGHLATCRLVRVYGMPSGPRV
jgi:hypothetical protein